jgi:hypothetical protein
VASRSSRAIVFSKGDARQLGGWLNHLTCLWSFGTLNPAHIPVAVEGRKGFKERLRFRLGREGRDNIRGKRVGLRPLWHQLDLDLRACFYAIVPPPGRAERQKVLVAI